MPTSVDVKNLKINKLTEAQYDTAVQGGVIGENELSVLTDVDLEQIQVSALPTASADELGKIYQYIGATDSTYTNGYFYKCVSDGQSPATYSWEAVEVQAGSGGGLPDQTGNAGKFLTTDGTDASWGNDADKFTAISTTLSSKVEYRPYCAAFYPDKNTSECCEYFFSAGARNGISYFSLLFQPRNSSRKKHLGAWNYTFDRIYVDKIVNGDGADINVPTTGGTLALTSDLPSSPATMPELTVAGWSNNTQTVTVTGVTATNTVFVSPAPASASDYASAGIICTAQGTDSLTFTCTTVPTNAITVNVVIMG